MNAPFQSIEEGVKVPDAVIHCQDLLCEAMIW